MKTYKTFTSFSVDSIEKAKTFYKETLGLDDISMEDSGVLMVHTGGDTKFMVYHRENHSPADYTVLNFSVDDLEAVVARLKDRGVTFEQVEDTNENGIADMGPMMVSWTKDPAGNWIGFFQNK